jgi:hypothetical protein
LRATTYLFVNESDREVEVLELLAGAGFAVAEVDDTFHRISAASDSEELALLRERLRAAGISFLERREHVYSDDELRRYPLLSLFITSAEAGMGGPTHGTEFDLSDACPECGTGARQKGALALRKSELPTDAALFQTLDGEVLVSPSLANALKGAGLAGLELRQAVGHRDGGTLDFFQLIPVSEMPPWHSSSIGYERERPCPSCDRDGFFDDPNVPFEIVYGKNALEAAADISWTYERLGNSGIREDFSASHFAAPRPLVSPRFVDVLRNEGVRNCAFLPVRAAD